MAGAVTGGFGERPGIGATGGGFQVLDQGCRCVGAGIDGEDGCGAAIDRGRRAAGATAGAAIAVAHAGASAVAIGGRGIVRIRRGSGPGATNNYGRCRASGFSSE